MDALRSNTTGVENTASGLAALYSNTTGNDNTASGMVALYNNATGDLNTASDSAAYRKPPQATTNDVEIQGAAIR